MQISEIRVKLVDNRNDRLKAFCSVTFDDDFVVHDLKIIEGLNGLFIAMPSRKVTDHCHCCGTKNHLRAKFCNECGKRLKEDRGQKYDGVKFHTDIAHPVNTSCREIIQAQIIDEYHEELERSEQPDYMPSITDDPDDEFGESTDTAEPDPDIVGPSSRPSEPTDTTAKYQELLSSAIRDTDDDDDGDDDNDDSGFSDGIL
ncbi:MAG: SpoVG family protein [Sedimentisphaerales bacterium]|nr:SpoVG family protein [Sedimentisphaerales bacterium]